ncbi:acyl-CoA N-acyltransferase [Striga asiatica]|uniref:Acyl-CoA N-acyltransferase n=1 Tax=Striga asiatica TaxID=4170 RepID=A0A5A7PKN0_STRAF|nr:acyl-CoA N-acyltransferase [Striga asiatica]
MVVGCHEFRPRDSSAAVVRGSSEVGSWLGVRKKLCRCRLMRVADENSSNLIHTDNDGGEDDLRAGRYNSPTSRHRLSAAKDSTAAGENAVDGLLAMGYSCGGYLAGDEGRSDFSRMEILLD